MTTSFDGEVALVTGGSSGIGRATALAFATAGARVVVAARRRDESEETVSLIQSAGGDGIFVQADVTRGADLEALVARTVLQYGRLDFAVNNAGIHGVRGTAETYPEEIWDQVMATNLRGVFLSMKYELPHLVASGGAIVNMASVSGMIASSSLAYSASKWGVIGLTKSTALQYAARGVRVNAVAPAFVDTPIVERLFEQTDDAGAERIRAMQPLGQRLGTPDEVAGAVLWLCSQEASFITGHVLNVDGGFMLAH